jgi:deferrochelatase/peroxidase EfeB
VARGKALIDFTYKDDPQGLKCPISSHMRRVNTRDGLAPTGTEGSVLNNRRRILRRGLPYGDSSEGVSDSDEHGVVMLVACTSLFRQFEFVQNAWIMGTKFDGLSGESDPLLGDREPVLGGHDAGSYSLPREDRARRSIGGMPQFVTVRGGAYFFLPGIRALRYLARTTS